MDFGRLQRQAASCVDELLSVSTDMEEYVISAYGQAPQDMVAMQCRIQLERLKRLGKKLAGIREELALVTKSESAKPVNGLDVPGLPPSARGLSVEQQRSIAVTEQIIGQNLLIISQKEELLKGFLAHSAMAGVQQKRAKELQDTAEIIRLRKILGEQIVCKTESEK